jgi:hypothetical protein
MAATCSSEMSVDYQLITRSYFPEDRIVVSIQFSHVLLEPVEIFQFTFTGKQFRNRNAALQTIALGSFGALRRVYEVS